MSSKKSNPDLNKKTNVNVNDPNKTSGSSPPDVEPYQKRLLQFEGSPDINAKWEDDLAVIVATKGIPEERVHWVALHDFGDAALKCGDYTQARKYYENACQALWIDTAENIRSLTNYHPAMLKILLRLADLTALTLAFDLMADVHDRLAIVMMGLIGEYKGWWAYTKAVLSRESNGNARIDVESFIGTVRRTTSRIDPVKNPKMPLHLLSELRLLARQMVTAFDAAQRSGLTLDDLRGLPHRSRQ